MGWLVSALQEIQRTRRSEAFQDAKVREGEPGVEMPASLWLPLSHCWNAGEVDKDEVGS